MKFVVFVKASAETEAGVDPFSGKPSRRRVVFAKSY